METKYKVKCLLGFLDGNAYPRRLGPGEVIEVDEATYRKLVQSDPQGFEVLEATKQVPPPTRAPEPNDEITTNPLMREKMPALIEMAGADFRVGMTKKEVVSVILEKATEDVKEDN